MGKKKWYAVKKGRETGIFLSWEECRRAVEGFPGAQYAGFATQEDAADYLKGGSVPEAIVPEGVAGEESDPQTLPRPSTSDWLLAYVDGSYDHAQQKYAFGCVFILWDGREYVEKGNGTNPESAKLRNVTGEMLGAMFAVRFALANGFTGVEICYDYEGIEKWVSGVWRSRTELTVKYRDAMRGWEEGIQIRFRKVPAHSHVYYNELADRLAKEALQEEEGIPAIPMLADMEPL